MTGAARNIAPRGNVTDGRDQVLSLPRCHVYRNAGLSIATGTDTYITWDTLYDIDVDGMWDPLNPTRLYCRTAGTYRLTGWGDWPATGGNIRQMRIRVNGGAKLDGPITRTRDPGDGSAVQSYSSFEAQLDANDYVEMFVNQNTGAGLAFNAATAGSWVNGFQAACVSLP